MPDLSLDTLENAMPVRKVRGGWQYARKGKVYPRKVDALRQQRAVHASKRSRKRR